MSKSKKILLAAGGTGGHLFPAQALADDLHGKGEILFCGSGLTTNRCFQKERFKFTEIVSTEKFFSLFLLAKGFFQSLRVLNSFKPDLIVGFGSFHTLPILVAAVIKKVPFILYESNAYPGKVIRLFSRFAKCTYVSFESAKKHLRGKCVVVQMPACKKQFFPKEEARNYFGLKEKKTLLVFGGSQGALAINAHFIKAAELLKKTHDFQVIHLLGKNENYDKMKREYEQLQIDACVKVFEESMFIAWQAADLVICRAGAASVFEQLHYGIPGILIPYPYATDMHQEANARFVTEDVRGGKLLVQKDLSAEKLREIIVECLDKELENMGTALQGFKEKTPQKTLSDLIGQQFL